jgi:hypothetical protein
MKTIITSVVLLIALSLQAQNFKFGKVSKYELAEKVHPKDPTANAALLFKRESVRFDYRKGDGFTQVRTKFTIKRVLVGLLRRLGCMIR